MFFNVARCNHELSPDKLPKSARPSSCSREPWSGAEDERCILHTSQRIEDTSNLEAEIRHADRIDGLKLTHHDLSEGFEFENMELYGGDFQNADLNRCNFINTEIYHSRFEEAELEETKFGKTEHDESEADKGVVKSRVPIRYCSFDSANLREASFHEVNFLKTTLRGEDMIGIKLIDCSLPQMKFRDQNLRHSTFAYSSLRHAVFEKCNLQESNFNAAILKDTRFNNTNIYNSDFRNAVLDEADFIDVEIDHRTKFDSILVHEFLSDRYSEGKLNLDEIQSPKNYLHNRRGEVPISFEEKTSNRNILQRTLYGLKRLSARRPGKKKSIDYDHLEHARYRYRDLARIFKSNDEPEKAREYSVREKHAKRKNSLRNETSSWTWLAFTRWTMRYGEEPIQPLKAAVILVIGSAFLYPIFGVEYVDSSQRILYCSCFSIRAPLSILHLSIVRLLNVSNTAVQPVSLGVVLAVSESIAGALLTAMFVFTLGRRATE